MNRLFGNDIFLSYSSLDRPWAIALEKLLIFGRFRVFRDDTQLNTGDHLDRLLKEVRQSTMLMVLVTEHSAASDWVFHEFTTYLERPRKQWRIAPVFLDPQSPRALPEKWKVLGDFHGVTLPASPDRLTQLPQDRQFLAELTSEFRATRLAALRLMAGMALAVFFVATVGSLILRNQRNSTRDAFIKSADLEKAASRFDLAEADLARAWEVQRTPAILASYREARARRMLEHPLLLPVGRELSVVAVGELGGIPYAILHSNDDAGALDLLHSNARRTLASPCDVAPLVATSSAAIVWTCGKFLSALGALNQQAHTVKLPAAPLRLRLAGEHLELLFREEGVSQLGVFEVPALRPLVIDPVQNAPAGGEMGFCPDPGTASLLWSFSAEEGFIVARRWAAADVKPQVNRYQPPSAEGAGPLHAVWISRVIPSADCQRFFVEYAPFTLEKHSVFEMLRIRIDSARPLDRFDTAIEELAPSPDESGIEAVYRTSSKELRAFLLTSPVVLTTQVRTIASGVQRFAALPGRAKEMWAIALDERFMSLYRNGDLWSRQLSKVGEPVHAVSSSDSNWVAVEGEDRTILWRRSQQPWTGMEPPPVDQITSDTAVHLP